MSAVRTPSINEPSQSGDSVRIAHRHDLYTVAIIGVLLIANFIVGVWAASQLSVTHDEYWHLPVGILNLRTVRFDYEPLNPPLTRLVAATAVTVAEPGSYRGPVPVSGDATTYGLQYLRMMGARHQPSFVWGRAANLLFSLLTGSLLALWSWHWWGRTAACVTALLWCTEPTVLAHGSLITPDAGLVCLTCAVWYALWCYFQRPTLRRAILCGGLLGLAQLTKFTAIILFPLLGVTWLIWWTFQRGNKPAAPGDPAAGAAVRPGTVWHPAVTLTICLLVMNLGYGCEGTGSTLNQVQPKSRTVSSWLVRMPMLGRIPVPLPKAYLTGLDAQKHVMESQHPVYLDRRWSETGFRFYFLWALWYKLPHVWQLLCLLACVQFAWRGTDSTLRRQLCYIGVPLIILLSVASLSGMQLGVRYVLPIYPFLCLLAASVFAASRGEAIPSKVSQKTTPAIWRRRLLYAVVVLSPLALRFHPQHLAYFNELAGGPTGGAEHLLDSNLDWGQDLLELRSYVQKQPDYRWGIAYFGSLPPGELGLHYEIPPGHGPSPGTYAVSVNFVYGRPHVAFDQTGQPRPVGVEEFGYFRAFTPIRRIGASILIYQIRPTDVLRWNGH